MTEKKEVVNMQAKETIEFMQFILEPLRSHRKYCEEQFIEIKEKLQELKPNLDPVINRVGKFEKDIEKLDHEVHKCRGHLGRLDNAVFPVPRLEKELQDHFEQIRSLNKAVMNIPKTEDRVVLCEKAIDEIMQTCARIEHELKKADNDFVKFHDLVSQKMQKIDADQHDLFVKIAEKSDENKNKLMEMEKKQDEANKAQDVYVKELQRQLDKMQKKHQVDFENLFKDVEKELLHCQAVMNEAEKKFGLRLDEFAKEIEDIDLVSKNMEIMEKRLERTFLQVKEIRVHLNL